MSSLSSSLDQESESPPGMEAMAGFAEWDHANPRRNFATCKEEDFCFRQVTFGIERAGGCLLARHRHLEAYATVVLTGSFVDASYAGRIRAKAGDVLIHPALDCHANHPISTTLTVMHLPWKDLSGQGAFYRCTDAEGLARIAQQDPIEAARVLKTQIEQNRLECAPKENDWPDLLANALKNDTKLQIAAWAAAHGLTRETVSRGFRSAYGVSPATFRGELRARLAWLAITRSSERLSMIAATLKFADQAHMSRWVYRVAGAPPAAWRRRAGSGGPRRMTASTTRFRPSARSW